MSTLSVHFSTFTYESYRHVHSVTEQQSLIVLICTNGSSVLPTCSARDTALLIETLRRPIVRIASNILRVDDSDFHKG